MITVYYVEGRNVHSNKSLPSGMHPLVTREGHKQRKLPNKVGSAEQGECPPAVKAQREAEARLPGGGDPRSVVSWSRLHNCVHLLPTPIQ